MRDGVRVGNRTEGVAIRTCLYIEPTSGVREKGRNSTFPIRSRTPDLDLTPLLASDDSRPWKFHNYLSGNFH